VSLTDNIYTQDAINAGTQVTHDVARAARQGEAGEGDRGAVGRAQHGGRGGDSSCFADQPVPQVVVLVYSRVRPGGLDSRLRMHAIPTRRFVYVIALLATS
jgi:hypothetical protein